MRKILIAVLITLLSITVMTGCQFTISGTTAEEEVEQAGVDYIISISDTIISEDDFEEMDTQGDIQPSFQPYYGLAYVKEGVDTIVVDKQVDEENGFAYVDATVSINGRLEYYYDEEVVIKDADISGTAYIELEKTGEEWTVVARDISFSTVDSGLTINEPLLSPQPVVAGNALQVTCNIDSEYDNLFGVLASSRASYYIGCILDYSETYNTLTLNIRNDISPGTYGGFIKAMVWGSIIDPEQPIEINIKSFEFEVIDEDK